MTRRRIPLPPSPPARPPQTWGQRYRRATPPSRGPPAKVETIAERRVIALRLRKAGGSYREIAGQLAVDVATAYGDVRTGQVLDAIDQTGLATTRSLAGTATIRQDVGNLDGLGQDSDGTRTDQVASMSSPPLPASRAVSVYPIVALRHD